MDDVTATDYFIGVAQQALWVLSLACAPILLPALIAGLVLGMIQAATSINEQTLSFVPKLIIVGMALALTGGTIMMMMVDFTQDMFARIPGYCKVTEIGTLASLEAQLMLWVVAMIRPGAAFLVAPVFGAPAVPVQVRIIVALAIGIPAMANANYVMPVDGLVSVAGIAMMMGEALAGLAIGFAVLIGFNAAMISGELISNTMGLGFAGMVDPGSGASSPALSTFLSILATFLFLSINGHLMLAAIIVESFKTLPPGEAWMVVNSSQKIVLFGSELFAAGLAIALPVGFALVLVQIVMGILARSAPAMNLFSVGMPATLMAGLVLLAISAPIMGDGIVSVLMRGLSLSRELAGG